LKQHFTVHVPLLMAASTFRLATALLTGVTFTISVPSYTVKWA